MRDKLILWEKANGYKANWVAEKLGISPASYSKIKSGKQNPSIDFAYKFKKIFPDVDVLELMKKS